MPSIKHRTAFRVMRGLTAFLNLDAGLVRGDAPDPERTARQLEQARRRLAEQEKTLERARKRIAQLEKLEESYRSAGLSAENIIWVFGNIRTGSTWLASMMGDMKGHAMWNEPRVGELFGHFFYERAFHRKENENFIMGLRRKPVWIKSIRAFVLDSVAAKYPGFARGGYLVIKEPSGSIGAPLLAEALPESRMILLVRDPRDVVASALDTARKDSWAHRLKGSRKRREALGESAGRGQKNGSDGMNPDSVVKSQANKYLQFVGNSKRAYEAHEGPKTLVRYEDLREETLKEMGRIYSELGIEVDERELARVVEKHAWENIPEDKKGEGKFHRKATPGGWREDLTPRQAEVVERITAPLLKEFYGQ